MQWRIYQVLYRMDFATCGLSLFSADAVDYDILNKHSTKKKKIVNISQGEPQQIQNIQFTTTEENEHKKHLEHLESRLALDILLNFQEAVKSKSFVISNSNNQRLFEYWHQCRIFYGASIIYS